MRATILFEQAIGGQPVSGIGFRETREGLFFGQLFPSSPDLIDRV